MEGVLQLKRELHDVLLEEAQHGLELYGDISYLLLYRNHCIQQKRQ